MVSSISSFSILFLQFEHCAVAPSSGGVGVKSSLLHAIWNPIHRLKVSETKSDRGMPQNSPPRPVSDHEHSVNRRSLCRTWTRPKLTCGDCVRNNMFNEMKDAFPSHLDPVLHRGSECPRQTATSTTNPIVPSLPNSSNRLLNLPYFFLQRLELLDELLSSLSQPTRTRVPPVCRCVEAHGCRVRPARP